MINIFPSAPVFALIKLNIFYHRISDTFSGLSEERNKPLKNKLKSSTQTETKPDSLVATSNAKVTSNKVKQTKQSCDENEDSLCISYVQASKFI